VTVTREILLVAISISISIAGTARADHDLCAPGAHHHGAPVDLDVKGAEIADVMRLLTDAAHLNLVVGGEVGGKVTLHLQHVPWDQAACAVAGLHHLVITLEGTILLVRARAAP
jgi:type II secretory pathway component HofQ